MQFRATDKFGNMTSLQLYVSGVRESQIEKLFGRGREGVEPEKGYRGPEWTFECDEDGSIATLYPRWGMWRIGAHNKEVAYNLFRFLNGLGVVERVD